MPKIAVPPAAYPTEGQNWFLYNLGLKDNILEEAIDWLKENSAYRCGEEDEPHPILDCEWENNKKKKIIMDYLFKKTDGKGASIATGNIDSHRFISNESGQSGLWYNKSLGIRTLVETASSMTTKLLCPSWITRNASILYSKKGGEDQGMHHDDPREKKDKEKYGQMASVLISVMDGTKINIWEGDRRNLVKRVIEIPKGYCFVYDGSLLHSGCGYENDNVRIHLYLGTKDLILDNMIQTVYICPVCEKVHLSNGALRSHKSRYCFSTVKDTDKDS